MRERQKRQATFRDFQSQQERMFEMLKKAIQFMVNYGKLAEWLDIRTSAAVLWSLGLCNIQKKYKSYVESGIDKLFESTECNYIADYCNFNYEVWDTSLVLLALTSSNLRKYHAEIRGIENWLKKEFSFNSVKGEPWETLWANLALMTSEKSRSKSKSYYRKIRSIDWLLSVRNKENILISPQYSGLFLEILGTLIKQYELPNARRTEFNEVIKAHFDYLVSEFHKGIVHNRLWRDEPWQIGLILLGLSNSRNSSYALFEDSMFNSKLEERLGDLWEDNVGWNDMVDTSNLSYGLATYLFRRSEYLHRKGIMRNRIHRGNFVEKMDVSLEKRVPGKITSVFISYSRKDLAMAKKLRDALDKRGLTVRMDVSDIDVLEDFEKKIRNRIHTSDYLLTIITRNSLKSKWVIKELNVARNRERENEEIFIIPLLFEKCELPSFLKRRNCPDFTDDFEFGFGQLVDKILPNNINSPGFDTPITELKLFFDKKKCPFCKCEGEIIGVRITALADRKNPNLLCKACGNWW